MAAKGKMNSEKGIRDAIRSQTMIEIEEEDWRPVSIQKTIVSTPYDDSILDEKDLPDFIFKTPLGKRMLLQMNGGPRGIICPLFMPYLTFLQGASSRLTLEHDIGEHGIKLTSTKGKLSAKVKCDLNSAWTDGVHTEVFTSMLNSGRPYATNLDQKMRFPIFLESYYRKIEPSHVDLSLVSQETQIYMKQANVKMDELAARDEPLEVYADEDKRHFCAWLEHIGVYDRILETFCALPVKSAMSIVLADRLGWLYVDADIEIVRSADVATWSATKEPGFGRFV
jgi:hypothetical protein